MKTKRAILTIDEALCNGCGNCVTDCAEGAIAIRDGKAAIISDAFCDGLGACLGSCPTGALALIEREAVPFDAAAAPGLAKTQGGRAQAPGTGRAGGFSSGDAGGCPGSLPFSDAPWPVKLRLIPVSSPFLKGKDLLIAADCAPAVAEHFRERHVKGAQLLIVCPKFEDREELALKLAGLFREAAPASCAVLRMEVPCCGGLSRIVRAAWERSGKTFPLRETVLGRNGRPARAAGIQDMRAF